MTVTIQVAVRVSMGGAQSQVMILSDVPLCGDGLGMVKIGIVSLVGSRHV